MKNYETNQLYRHIFNFADFNHNGWLVEFQGDSLQTKATEIHYLNDTIDGTVKIYMLRFAVYY